MPITWRTALAQAAMIGTIDEIDQVRKTPNPFATTPEIEVLASLVPTEISSSSHQPPTPASAVSRLGAFLATQVDGV
jgi:hypothetical protein